MLTQWTLFVDFQVVRMAKRRIPEQYITIGEVCVCSMAGRQTASILVLLPNDTETRLLTTARAWSLLLASTESAADAHFQASSWRFPR